MFQVYVTECFTSVFMSACWSVRCLCVSFQRFGLIHVYLKIFHVHVLECFMSMCLWSVSCLCVWMLEYFMSRYWSVFIKKKIILNYNIHVCMLESFMCKCWSASSLSLYVSVLRCFMFVLCVNTQHTCSHTRARTHTHMHIHTHAHAHSDWLTDWQR